MNRVAIIAAMPGELKPLVRGWRHECRNGVDLWSWRFDEGEWVAACAGAGADAATRAFAEVETTDPISMIISTGWAGALSGEFESGLVYRVSGVIDARTGERFRTSYFAEGAGGLKGHGFSRAVETQNTEAALAAEGTPEEMRTLPQGLKPRNSYLSAIGTAEAVPFQNECWLVTSVRVADVPEKRRLASTYEAALVDMEASAVARLAQMRGIPFYCVKGVSDGYRDQLPDFNRFILPNGKFQLGRFIVFCFLRPWYWLSLIRMGENSRKAAQGIRESLLDLMDERGYRRERNGDPDKRR